MIFTVILAYHATRAYLRLQIPHPSTYRNK